MSKSRVVREMLNDIRRQSSVLRDALSSLRTQAQAIHPLNSNGRVVLCGCGDNETAGHAVRLPFESYISIQSVGSMEASHYLSLSSDDVLVCVSNSGEVRRTVEAARNAALRGATVVAISCNDRSALSQASTTMVKMPSVVTSPNLPHTIEYTVTLLAVAAVLERLSGTDRAELCSVPDWVAVSDLMLSHCEQASDCLASARCVHFLGSGPHYATARYGAYKWWSAGLAESTYNELEEFAHGPHWCAEEGDAAVVIGPTGRSEFRVLEVCEGLEQMGLSVVLVTSREAIGHADKLTRVYAQQAPELWSAFATCVPVQLLCVNTAKRQEVALGSYNTESVHKRVHDRWRMESRLVVHDPFGQQSI